MVNSKFRFSAADFEMSTATAHLSYELETEADTYLFTEHIIFPAAQRQVSTPALQMLHMMCGISYYKLTLAKHIDTGDISLTPDQAHFWDTVYTKGLGELCYRNQIDFRDRIRFPQYTTSQSIPDNRPLERKSLVFFGGGKDSIVSAEKLKEDNEPYDLIAIRPVPLQRNTAAVAGKPLIAIERVIDPQLFELNRSGRFLNGHIPFNAIISAIGVVYADIMGYDQLIASNEKSANYGNVTYLGEEINHQWSKSEEYEHMCDAYIKRSVHPSMQYRSLLRAYDELTIMGKFISYPQYFHLFSSCNTNFVYDQNAPRLWCGACPKCLFSFILLAAYLGIEKTTTIFGKNLLNDPSLEGLLMELLGKERHKPFECVGTPDETQKALDMIRAKNEHIPAMLIQ